MRIHDAACESMGTKQCAPLCLSASCLGECPHKMEVWTGEAILKELVRRPDGPLAPYYQTASQILKAPIGAVFVWPVSGTRDYPKRLALHLGRADLIIAYPEILAERLIGSNRAVVVDHGCRLTTRQHEMIRAHHIWRVGE